LDIGELIVEETAPILYLAPTSIEQEQQIIEQFLTTIPSSSERQRQRQPQQNRISSSTSVVRLRDIISVPKEILHKAGSSGTDVVVARFCSMIQAALCLLHHHQQELSSRKDQMMIDDLLRLYHPDLSEPSTDAEKEIVHLSYHALEYLTTIARPGSLLEKALHNQDASSTTTTIQKSTLQTIMLIWACNAFEGGCIYSTMSRINHSCDPNAVIIIIPDNNHDHPPTTKTNTPLTELDGRGRQSVRAAARIRSGQEITISYLGTFSYADRTTRQHVLRSTKYFDCKCDHCCCTNELIASMPDRAASIPCPQCHPRMLPGKRQLEEDVQYDDEQTIHYICPVWKKNDEKDNSIVSCSYRCDACGFQYSTDSSLEESHADFRNLLKVSNSVVDKVLVFLKENQLFDKRFTSQSVDNDDAEESNMIYCDRLEQHLSMASSVLGARHFAPNLVMLLRIDHLLATFHARLLLNGSGNHDDEEEDEEATMETIAEVIDMLERVIRFVESLELKLHMGHLLSDVIIGTARALVSLGDVKSQKYAAEWLEKIADDYVQHFESDGIQKVVQTLRVAWKKNTDNDNLNTRPEKRAKR
jgi:hypothetical protein